MFNQYLDRVRWMVQRYVLSLEIGEEAPSSGQETPQTSMDAAYRCLFDVPPPPTAIKTLVQLEERLDVSYEALAALDNDGAEPFELVRYEFGLSDLACDVLWVMLAASLSPPFLWLYRALWGDKDRSFFDPTFVFHVTDPFGDRISDLYQVFDPTAPLRANRLLVELKRGHHEEADGVFSPSRALLRHLLGVVSELPNLPGLVELHKPSLVSLGAEEDPALSETMIGRLRMGFASTRRFVLIGSDNMGPLRLAHKAMSDQGAPLIEADVAGLVEGGEDAVVMLLGEARFRRAGIYLDRVEVLDKPEVPSTFVRRLMSLLFKLRIPLFFRTSWALSVDLRLKLVHELGSVELRLKLPEAEEREEIWRHLLEPQMGEEIAQQVAFSVRAYPFGIGEIQRAIQISHLQAMQRSPKKKDAGLRPKDVEAGCNTLSGQHIGDLARRVRVLADWDDVVLPKGTKRVIDDILRFGQFRKRVFEEEGFGEKLSYGRGLTALFWGPPGTGKTLVSGLIARQLGLELYRIELSQIVSKYIGETEQRLAQIFDEAEAAGMALLFDEADSLFAKRTEVKSSVDRYANLGVNYLLQRLENHDGVILLTTNFQASIDEAFMRRLRFKAEFPKPESKERALLWSKMIPERASKEEGIRFDALGEVWEMSGGEIRNAVLRAAFYAVEENVPLGLEHLDRAAQVEYKEAGRLLGDRSAALWLKKAAKKAEKKSSS